MALIRGIYPRFLHATVRDMEELLRKGGCSADIIKLAAPAYQSCSECRKWARPFNQPTPRAELACCQRYSVARRVLLVEESVVFAHRQTHA